MPTLRFRSPLVGAAVLVGSVMAITAANFGLREVVPVVSTGVVYLLAVLLVSTWWGLWMGLATAVLSALAWNWFHIPPTHQLTIAEGENWLALGVFLVAAVVTSSLAGRARDRAEEAEARRAEADLSAEMARQLLSGASLQESLQVVAHRIAAALGLSSLSIELSWVDGDERRRALPLIVAGERIGTVLLSRDASPIAVGVLEERVLPSLETLVAAARRRDELEAQVVETKALRRSNVVKTAVLRSVSHDLRSPLTAITAAAEGLESGSLSSDGRAELQSVIVDESRRLSRLVDNLLDLSRLQSGGIEPRPDWCALDEVVAAAVASVGAPADAFDVQLDEGLPLLEADAVQLERALANVLENAARHGGGAPVSVRAHASGPRILVRITDLGPGVAREELERIFEPFHGVGQQSGAGLGLAIARGFVEANGGVIRAESLPGQGTTFAITLPVGAQRPSAVS